VRWIGDQSIPLLGVKFGEMGFLAEASESNLPDVADAILEGDFTTNPRTRLRVAIRRDGRTLGRETVLNDVVINKGALARLADIDTFVDDRYLTTYRADGLILATPTGSTAYSLAAGGPIIHPEVSGIILTPISPFTLTIRPLIVPDSAVITVRLAKRLSDIMVTFDGQAGFEMEEAHEIVIQKSPHAVHMIDLPEQNYYELLKNKLRWSGSRV
jgi:NAD+ kinase